MKRTRHSFKYLINHFVKDFIKEHHITAKDWYVLGIMIIIGIVACVLLCLDVAGNNNGLTNHISINRTYNVKHTNLKQELYHYGWNISGKRNHINAFNKDEHFALDRNLNYPILASFNTMSFFRYNHSVGFGMPTLPIFRDTLSQPGSIRQTRNFSNGTLNNGGTKLHTKRIMRYKVSKNTLILYVNQAPSKFNKKYHPDEYIKYHLHDVKRNAIESLGGILSLHHNETLILYPYELKRYGMSKHYMTKHQSIQDQLDLRRILYIHGNHRKFIRKTIRLNRKIHRSMIKEEHEDKKHVKILQHKHLLHVAKYNKSNP